MKRRRPPAEDAITQSILRCMDAQGLRDRDICAKTGIGSDLFSRKMAGERKWSWRDIEKIAPVLGFKQPWNLFIKPEFVSVIRISAHEKFDYRETTYGEEKAEIRLEGDTEALSNTYCLLLTDNSMMPGFPEGTRFLSRMETWEEIKENDLVVYIGQDNKGQLYRISIKDEQILLRSLNPAISDLLLPKQQIRLCDRVFRADF